jgi:glucokinase
VAAPRALAVDVGGTRVRAAVVTRQGRVLARLEAPTRAADSPEAVVAQVADLARRLPAEGIAVAGVCAPGPLDVDRGMALATPTIAGFRDFPLRAALADCLPWPVHLEHDGHAAAWGEWRFGAGRGTQDMVYVTLSTGIGAGVVTGGRLQRGHRGMAGHAGHMTVAPGGPVCACGNRGCWEAIASGPAFAARARDAGFADGAAAFAAARAGDTAALALCGALAADIGLGLTNLIHLFSPALVVVGGGMTAGLDLLAPGIAAHIARTALPPFRGVPVLPAALGDNAGLVGAAALAFAARTRAMSLSPSQASG